MADNTQQLTPKTPVVAHDLINADGVCAELAPGPAGADGAAPATPQAPGSTSLDSTECDVVRALGNPDNTSLSADERGNRLAVLTFTRGGRPGIYRFTSGRLSSVERGAEPEPAKKQPAKKKRTAA